MKLAQAILEAIESLTANKLRSGLTSLGIVIGVAAVIAIVALGAGAEDSITSSISGIGTNLVFVMSGSMDDSVRNPKPITLQDMAAISDRVAAPSVEFVAPYIETRVQVSANGEQSNTTLGGVTPDYFTIRSYKVTEGEIINEEHLLGRASVTVIGVDVAEKLFDRTDFLVGESIRVEGQPFRIIGVLEEKGGMSGEDDQILIPMSTAQARLIRRSPSDTVDMLMVQAVSSDAVPAAEEEIAAILRQRHRTQVGQDDFMTFTQQDALDMVNSIFGVLTIFLGSIAAVSLVVGGIGIMNIMLVSVTERTKEIGLRKALGARKRDILLQFLTESSMLSFGGGVIGILLGWLIAFIFEKVSIALGSPFHPKVTIGAILMSTGMAIAFGLFFGIYPANRAANLEPVEALRHE